MFDEALQTAFLSVQEASTEAGSHEDCRVYLGKNLPMNDSAAILRADLAGRKGLVWRFQELDFVDGGNGEVERRTLWTLLGRSLPSAN
jgi:hypothetical protein